MFYSLITDSIVVKIKCDQRLCEIMSKIVETIPAATMHNIISVNKYGNKIVTSISRTICKIPGVVLGFVVFLSIANGTKESANGVKSPLPVFSTSIQIISYS